MAPSHVAAIRNQMNTTTADASLSVGRSFAMPGNARRWHLPKRGRPLGKWSNLNATQCDTQDTCGESVLRASSSTP
jgi:hypothetical protein